MTQRFTPTLLPLSPEADVCCGALLACLKSMVVVSSCVILLHTCVCVVLCPYQGLEHQPGRRRWPLVGFWSDLEEKMFRRARLDFPRIWTPDYRRSGWRLPL